ncbi:MAG: hypothetical protein E3J83_04285 [Candidatus Atribacteria bacterium]|nr:MAG: hypothetical protein E3J83_04285 [Candidatus Atribacteria bacterium]
MNKVKKGDFVILNKNADIINSVTSKSLSNYQKNKVDSWIIDDILKGDLINISACSEPYPGAYCSFVDIEDIEVV